jgi:hypothetical protein
MSASARDYRPGGDASFLGSRLKNLQEASRACRLFQGNWRAFFLAIVFISRFSVNME